MHRVALMKTCAVLALGLCLAAPLYAHHVKKGDSTTLPVTTSSAKARELYEKGMADYENLYLERCNDEWRAAVIDDPNLAVAWAWIAFNSSNPQEVSKARSRAKELAPKATPGEQLMVAWISKVQEGDFLGGITAMNDMLEMYPHDKHLLYLAGNWLMLEDGNEQAQKIMEKALSIDKNFPAALKIWLISTPATGSLPRHSQRWTAMSSCCPRSPTRRIPMESCSACPATSRARSSTIALRSRSILTS